MIPNPFILNSEYVLYHSTVNSQLMLQKNKFLWTSYDRKQSYLHIFNNCGRYEDYQGNQWPYCYKMQLQRSVRLFPVFIRDGKHYITNSSFSRIESMMFFNKKILTMELYDYISGGNEFGNDFVESISKLTLDENCNNHDFMQNCNSKILVFLNELNKFLDEPYDGYICVDDQKEIAFLNPIDVFNIDAIKQFKLVSVINNNTDEFISINYCHSDMNFSDYSMRFNYLFNKENLEIKLSGDPTYDLIQLKNKISIRKFSIEDSIGYEDKDIDLTEQEINTLEMDLNTKCVIINTDNMYKFVFEEKTIADPLFALSQIFKYHLCPKIIVHYTYDYKMELVNNVDMVWDFDE